MRNLALFLKYDGTAYHGWQVQKNACSVAQTLEEAAADVVGHPVHMTGCGRTDAGVHARTYVANFHTESRIPASARRHRRDRRAGGPTGLQRHRLLRAEGVYLSDL